ncbi:uncharacterized protein LOC127254817 [Andrographis paniculata]|uniref:uncharacterized protein LOC127254817 n=1 Tax=Andrographis paniculata TaxID=175694 RepID=UPI0021E86453|nr:uncharacterized protein LOC127254817 [Andrographis paniculata]
MAIEDLISCAFMYESRIHEILQEEMDPEAARRDDIGAASPLVASSGGMDMHLELVLQEDWDDGDNNTELIYSGTMAVAVVLTMEHIVVANCVDSLAILYHTGRIIPLTDDLKHWKAPGTLLHLQMQP